MANFRRHGFIKAAIKNGNISNNPMMNRNFIVPNPSLSCFKYDSKSCISEVVKVFDDMIQQTRPVRPVDEFNSILHNVVSTEKTYYSCSLVVDMFQKMCAVGVPINTRTAHSLIKCYCHLQHTNLSFSVLGCLFKQGIVCNDNVSIYNTILDGFIGEDRTHEAERLFKKMFKNVDDQLLLCEPDIVSYNIMLKGLRKVGNNSTAIALLRIMEGRGGCYKPDIDSYNIVIDGLCSDTGVVITIDEALKLFKEMVFVNIRHDADTYGSLIYALSKLRRWDEVCKMLKEMEEAALDMKMKTCNTIVDALCNQNEFEEACNVFGLMCKSKKYHPDIVTYNSLIRLLCCHLRVTRAWKVFRMFRSLGLEANLVTYNTLIYGYVKDIKLDIAIKLSTIIPKRLLMNNNNKNNNSNKNKVTKFLLARGLVLENPNLYLSHLYHKYDNSSDSYDDLKASLELFDFVKDGHHKRFNTNIQVYNVLIYGANKCKKFDIARTLFHELIAKGLQPDDVTYTLMIFGFGQAGLVKDSKRMFVKMKTSGRLLLDDDVVDDILLQSSYYVDEYGTFDY